MADGETNFYLGIDGAPHRTTAALADDRGVVMAVAHGPGLLLHGASAAEQQAVLRTLVRNVASLGEIRPDRITSVAVGLSGAEDTDDRRQTEAWISKVVAPARCFVECSAILSLRAATRDAVGVGVVVDRRTTCVGRDRYGRRHAVGGHGAISGDVGYAEDLAMRALGGAWMAEDGRAGPSSLSTAIPDAVGVGSVRRLPDLLERGELTPEVVAAAVEALFAEAEAGDGLAQKIIEDTGSRLGASAIATLRALGLRAANALVVLDGEMLVRSSQRRLVEATKQRIEGAVSEANVFVARAQRVVGAILFARDLMDHAPLAFADRLRRQAPDIDAYRRQLSTPQ